MFPFTSERNFTPSSTGLSAPASTTPGTVVPGQSVTSIANDDAQGLGDRLPIRSRHPCGEVERAGRRGRSGDDPCAAGERQARRQCPAGDRPGIRSHSAAGCQRGRVGHIQASIGQGGRGNRQRGHLHGQGRAADDSTQRGRDGGAAGIDGSGEAGAINSGHTRARGRPRDLARQVLRAAIGIGPGGGE